jgi:hypothetical protein
MSEFFKDGHALLIGVGGDLPTTVNDAQGLADILKDPKRCAYRPEQVDLLQSKNADRAGILASLDKLAKGVNEISTVVIYFSGHGYHSSRDDAYYLMPYGYDVVQLTETTISGAEFIDKLKAIKAQKLLLLLDCCHAGGMIELKAPGLQLTKVPMPHEALSLLSQGSGRVVIASSKADEKSEIKAGMPYSVFTFAVIEALCGKGASQKDGFVRVADLALHAREVVPRRTENRQHPILNYLQADNFVLSYYAGGETQFKVLPFDEWPERAREQAAESAIPKMSKEAQMIITKLSKTYNGRLLQVYWGIQIGQDQWMYQEIQPRERAALAGAIGELDRLGLIKGEGAETFRITTKGYQIADEILKEG